MAELLPHKLGLLKALPNDDQARSGNVRHCTVTNILEWTQYFVTYIIWQWSAKSNGLERHCVIELCWL